jgi:nitrogen fixation/metabolism regulation signal transduction histidine kinase
VEHIGWVVGFARPQGPLESQLRDRFVRQGGAITLVMLLAVAATALFARRLAAPLALLARRAGAIARGERSVLPRDIEDADVEVMQLADAMAAMGDAVADREETLREFAAREQAARAEAEAASARTRAVQNVTDAALAHLSLEKLLDELLARVREALKVDTATILLVDPEG